MKLIQATELTMKSNTLTRFNLLVSRILDTLVEEEKPAAVRPSQANRPQRKDFFYYMLVRDADTRRMVGHLSDISTGGFKLDTRTPVPVDQNFRFRMDLPGEISDVPYMVFGARSRWCKVDPLDPCGYNVGFQFTDVAPQDLEIFDRMMEKYGRDYEKRSLDLRHSNKW
jgi:hypothetical protein